MEDQDSVIFPQARENQNEKPEQPASWKESLLALGPFLLVPFFDLVGWFMRWVFELPAFPKYLLAIFTVTMAVVPILCFLVVIGISVARGFPRWTMPYWGLVLIIFLYLMTFSGTIAGQNFDGSWWVWLPVLLAAGAGYFLGKRSGWIGRVRKSAGADWTHLSFVIYGIVPAFLFASFDEVHDSQVMILSSMLILAAGALFYMRSAHTWQRILSLVAGLVLGWGLAALNLANYWGGRQEIWMDKPGDWWDTLLPMLYSGGIMLCILLLPMLLSVLRDLLLSKRRLGSAA